jgi:hypothetical protein
MTPRWPYSFTWSQPNNNLPIKNPCTASIVNTPPRRAILSLSFSARLGFESSHFFSVLGRCYLSLHRPGFFGDKQ